MNFDVLRRWLTASGYDVTFIRNVTDIDDKILAKAAEQGRPWFNLAYEMSRELDKALRRDQRAAADLRAGRDRARAGDARADRRADRRAATPTPAEDGSGDVYFDVRSWPSYGELTRQKVDDMEAAEDADPRGKRDPRDFALWKGWKKALEPETAAWPSPVGPGPAGLAHRVLGDGRRSTSAPPSTSTAAASTCASRTTRTSRPSPARPGTRSRRTGCTTPGSPPPARR